ncbi:MAG: hypothetical protein ACSHX3_09335 [Litorimonas sp.]
MFTVELAWFQFDLPDHATITAVTASPNPLFPDSRVTTQWIVALDRFELTAHLSATRDLTDISRAAFEAGEPDFQQFSQNGIPAIRSGAYDRDHTQINWGFHLLGLTLLFRLTAKAYPKTLPTEAEAREHAEIIASVQRVTRGG